MAQKVQVMLVDDLDGSEATETVAFSLDGASYEIDLNDDNAEKLREALAPFVGHARKVGRGGGAKRGRAAAASTSGGASAKEIREWARSNGFKVGDKGRISAEVREAYAAANG